MIQKPKGTYDVYGDYGKKVVILEHILNDLMTVYNYEYFRTPIFESSDLFHRSVGETTDIVSKETYDFVDRGERNMTLRPEGTAGIVRSFIENKRYGDPSMPLKAWYYGPMYRYERPQSGRFREFYQFGVEVFGSNDPMMDAEVISIPVNFYQRLGLKGVRVNINSLGDKESRENYRDALLEYFKPHLNELCEDCNNRYLKNPLRILDCKVDHELDIMKGAPKMIDFLNETSRKHFEDVKNYLDNIGIEYHINTELVRGLDYYTHTVFEVEADIPGFGSQNVLCGGGRYDNLVETLDGPSTPGVGFALGMERLLLALDAEGIDLIDNNGIDVYIIPMSENEKEFSFRMTSALRLAGYRVDMDYMNRNLKSNFKQSERLEAKYLLLIGEEELKNNNIKIKNNVTKEEDTVPIHKVLEYLDTVFDSCGCGECHNDPDDGCCH